jgi:sigma-B regulation protein RsbU (phosphoserine phosphatase)
MQPGDVLFLCTDGIVEAVDREDEQFGQGRLEALIRKHAAAPPSELVLTVGAAVEEYYVGDAPADDLTILAVRRLAT